jgi:phosphomevalonate kinase
MLQGKTTIKTPGKLMVAGEYAVLEPYHTLVVTAVNRFVYIQIEQSDKNKVSLTDFNLHHLSWHFEDGKIIVDHTDHRLDFVKKAKEVTFRYLQEIGVPVHPVAIAVTSELDDDSGIKYGLGSSAAVTTGIVQAILEHFLGDKPSKLMIFKLASIAHVMTQGNGSGADIAASTYGGVLAYTSFQAEWLLNKMKEITKVSRLVESEWLYLSIQQIQFPDETKMLVGWTGKAASTKELVHHIKLLRETRPGVYGQFLQHSQTAVAKVVQGMKGNDRALFFTGMEENRIALSELGEAASVQIETVALLRLSVCAATVGGAGKLSGAGGGDCGIAFIPTKTTAESLLHEKWIVEGIKPLDLTSYFLHEN